MIDVRFPTTLQLMLSLALAAEENVAQLNSAQLAEGTGTHATSIRRLLVLLSKSGLIAVARGRDGGVSLARPASQITLRDIYEATFGDECLWAPRENVPHRCVVSNNINGFFQALTADTKKVILESLETRTLADSLKELQRANIAAMA